MKKLILFISTLIIFFIIFLIIYIFPKEYTINYKINKINITETYNKKDKGYLYILNYNNLDYPIFINKKYTKQRKHINKIDILEHNDEVCLKVNNKEFICSQKNELIDINLTSNEFKNKFEISDSNLENQKEEYKNIIIFNNNYNYLIWNYKGFINIKENHYDHKELLKNDNYKNELGYQTDKYFIFPDYDSKYYFNKLNIYNIKENLIETITFDYEISYDSYYLGNIKDKIYLIDKKNKQQYEINLKKLTIKIIGTENKGFKIYENGEFHNYKANNVLLKQIKFKEGKKIVNYILENNTLYLTINNHKIKITDKKVDKIIMIKNSTVFYLVKDELYEYNKEEKNKILLKYQEWNFNNTNQIYIFD